MTYPTSEDIKRVVRAAKEEAYRDARHLARQIRRQDPESDARAVRCGRGNIRFGYGGTGKEQYGMDWCDFEGTTYPTVRWLKTFGSEWAPVGRGEIAWIEFEAHPKVTKTELHPSKRSGSKRRTEVDLDTWFDTCIHPATHGLWSRPFPEQGEE